MIIMKEMFRCAYHSLEQKPSGPARVGSTPHDVPKRMISNLLSLPHGYTCTYFVSTLDATRRQISILHIRCAPLRTERL